MGTLAVDEFESDELVEDSADEKRIRKATEKAAKKKKKMPSNLGLVPAFKSILIAVAITTSVFEVCIPFIFIVVFFLNCMLPL